MVRAVKFGEFRPYRSVAVAADFPPPFPVSAPGHALEDGPLLITLIQALRQPALAGNRRGQICLWNPAAEAHYGWQAAAVVGRSVSALCPTLARPRAMVPIGRALRRGKPWVGVVTGYHRQGHTISERVTVLPLPGAPGGAGEHEVGWVGLVGASDRPDAALPTTVLQQYERIIAATQDGVALVDRQYCHQIVNQSYLDWFGSKREAVLGKPMAQLLGDEDFSLHMQAPLERCLAGETVQVEGWFTSCHPSLGHRRYLSVVLSPYRIGEKTVAGAVSVARDITALKQAEAAITRQAAQDRIIAEVVQMVHHSLDLETIFATAVEAMGRLIPVDHIALAEYQLDYHRWLHRAEYRQDPALPSCLGLAIPDESNPVAAQLHRGQIVCVDDSAILDDPIHRELHRQFPGAWLIIPLKINPQSAPGPRQGQIWGCLTLRQLAGPWAAASVALALRLADQLAVAIQQANLHHQLQQELHQRQRTEVALAMQASRFQSLYEQAAVGILLCTPDQRMVQANQRLCQLTGYSEQELVQMGPGRLLCHPVDRTRYQRAFASPAPANLEHRLQCKDGAGVWVQTTASPIYTEAGQLSLIAYMVVDVSPFKRAEAQLRHNAHHDGLTGLPNRDRLMQHLERVLHRSRQGETRGFAVLFLDLDRFKLVNDSLGHRAGDQLLQSVAQDLQQLIGPTDLAARLGGDEFVIVLDLLVSAAAPVEVAQRVLQRLRRPRQVAGRQLYLTASVGVLGTTAGYPSATELLRDADTAMYQAKARGKNGYALFQPAMHHQITHRLDLEHDLHRALQDDRGAGRLFLHYQPIINTRTGTLAGVEALVRWHHPQRGSISPLDFIPVAEETGQVVALDRWVMGTACRQVQQWRTTYPQARQLKVSVNLSPQELLQPDLLTAIQTCLHQTDLPGQQLTLEITERMLVQDTQTAVPVMDQVRSLGVGLALDDFGTGYSSLSYLHRFPLTVLKIDRSFMADFEPNSINREIVATIAALGHRLGLVTVAEGGKTAEHLQYLSHLGCTLLQTFYLCPPLPAADLESLLAQEAPFATQLREAKVGQFLD